MARAISQFQTHAVLHKGGPTLCGKKRPCSTVPPQQWVAVSCYSCRQKMAALRKAGKDPGAT